MFRKSFKYEYYVIVFKKEQGTMKRLLLIPFLLLAACTQSGYDTTKEIEMIDTAGDKVGTATLSEQPEGVRIKLKLDGIAPGVHAIHVHEFPKCEQPDFTSAGEHFNPDGKEHGKMNSKGPHLGDLPNIEADAAGKVDVELMLAEATLMDGKQSLVRDKGTSLIVHESQDDGYSQPSGNSGARILCGKITADKKE